MTTRLLLLLLLFFLSFLPSFEYFKHCVCLERGVEWKKAWFCCRDETNYSLYHENILLHVSHFFVNNMVCMYQFGYVLLFNY